MSWEDWVTGYIINHTETNTGEQIYAICRRGAIVGSDGSIWGQVNFNFETYEIEQEDNNGVMQKIVVDEWQNFITSWESDGRELLPGGVRLNGEKFFLSSIDKDRDVMYFKGTNSGLCIAKSDTCFCIGVYYNTGEPLETSFGKTRNYSAGNANGAVENCRDKCREQGV